MLKSKRSVVTKNIREERFDVASTILFPEFSRKKIKIIIDNGGAYLNKKRITVAKFLVRPNDVIELFWDDAQTAQTQLTKDNIIFENEFFIILNKPAGIPVQGTLDSDKNTILYALNKYDSNKYPLNKMSLVHRLDKETSGLMIIAKDQQSQKEFENLFREQKIEKIYKALCFFPPKQKEGVIKFPIAKDISRKNTYFAVTNKKKYPDQKEAETAYKVEKILAHGVALIACFPKTGRTHQVRVHLLSMGCPIIGDKTYAQNVYGHPYARTAVRQLLHAYQLKFNFKGKDYIFECPLPETFNI